MNGWSRFDVLVFILRWTFECRSVAHDLDVIEKAHFYVGYGNHPTLSVSIILVIFILMIIAFSWASHAGVASTPETDFSGLPIALISSETGHAGHFVLEAST